MRCQFGASSFFVLKFILDKLRKKLENTTMSEKTACVQKQRVKPYVNSNSLSYIIEENKKIYPFSHTTTFKE